MDVLYLLIPLSAVLVLGIVAVFGWAVHSGQFDDLEREGQQALAGNAPEALDGGQGSCKEAGQQFATEVLDRGSVAAIPGRDTRRLPEEDHQG